MECLNQHNGHYVNSFPDNDAGSVKAPFHTVYNGHFPP